MAERLAWARKRGIEPPAFALVQARAAGLDLTLIATERDSRDDESKCCRSDSLATAAGGKGNSCCSDHGVQAASDDEREDHIVAQVSLSAASALKVQAGKRTLTIQPADLEHYRGSRGRRGNHLPRGFQRVDSLLEQAKE
jgi:hypothetical protein